MGETEMKRLIIGLLFLAITPFVAFSIPENPGGTVFDVVGCTGVYRIDGNTFVIDCVNDNAQVPDLRADLVSIGGIQISSTTITMPGGVTLSSSTVVFSAPITIGDFVLYGSTDTAGLQFSGCVGGKGKCGIWNSDEADLYISTSTDLGAWRNSRTGKGP
jgi:hypothetical protein